MSAPVVLSYGMGTNSTAMLIGAKERGLRPALIMAAACWGAHRWLADRLATTTFMNNLALVLGPIAVGVAVYFAAAFAMAGEEMRAIFRAHRRG